MSPFVIGQRVGVATSGLAWQPRGSLRPSSFMLTSKVPTGGRRHGRGEAMEMPLSLSLSFEFLRLARLPVLLVLPQPLRTRPQRMRNEQARAQARTYKSTNAHSSVTREQRGPARARGRFGKQNEEIRR